MNTEQVFQNTKGECNMDQYMEYMKQVIIETITTTKDKDTIQLIYGLLMKSESSQVEYPSAS